GSQRRHYGKDDQSQRQQRRRQIKQIRRPTMLVQDANSHGITRAKMQEKRCEERERNAVNKPNGEIEILPRTDRPISVKHERGKTNPSKMQNKWRRASLLEQHKTADRKPNQTDYREKDYRRCP